MTVRLTPLKLLNSPEKADNKDFEKIAFKSDLFRNITLYQEGTRFNRHPFLYPQGMWKFANFCRKSLFLQLNNCDVIEQKIYGGIALKGDILNHPEVLKEANLIGEKLVSALEGKNFYDPVAQYEEEYLICPVCRGDLFQLQSNGQMSCGICGAGLQKKGLVNHYEAVSIGKFTKEGAQEHTRYVGGRILTGMDLSVETARRLKLYEADGTIMDEKPVAEQKHEVGKIIWEQEADDTFKFVVPKAFQGFVRTAVEKKAAAQGYSVITKDIFLAIKKASGN